MSRTQAEKRPWTDEDIATISSNPSLTAKHLAERLGRTPGSVSHIRHKLRHGWERKLFPWTQGEDDALAALAGTMPAGQIAKRLAGRTLHAVETRLRDLGISAGVPGGHKYNPHAPGTRTILASTCTRCGKFLDRSAFPKSRPDGQRKTHCLFCEAKAGARRYAENPDRRTSRLHLLRESARMSQEVSLQNAERSGQAYLESDLATLSDPSLSLLDKALTLKRTYMATANACHKFGYSSRTSPLGRREFPQWSIDNPNAVRRIKQKELVAV